MVSIGTFLAELFTHVAGNREEFGIMDPHHGTQPEPSSENKEPTFCLAIKKGKKKYKSKELFCSGNFWAH